MFLGGDEEVDGRQLKVEREGFNTEGTERVRRGHRAERSGGNQLKVSTVEILSDRSLKL
jgi:hypothetical protein